MGASSSVEVANAFPSDVWVRVDSERVLVKKQLNCYAWIFTRVVESDFKKSNKSWIPKSF